MLSVPELEKLMTDLESDRVERKSSFPGFENRERVRQAVCAFANDLPGHGKPGYVFVGVSDSGMPIKLTITDELLRSLSDIRTDGKTLPPPRMSVEKVEISGTPVAVVEVWPSDTPPVRYAGQVWIRVGPRRATATAEEERRLTERQISGSRTFDHRPCLDATLDDLILGSFRNDYLPKVVDSAILAANDRSVEEQLASLRSFDLKRGVPTYAGVLVFGRDPLNFLPGAYIQFVRFEGDTLSDPVRDEKAITGNLLTQLLQLDNLLPIHVQTARTVEGLRAEERPDYPLVAVRELALNAVMHRVYEPTTSTPVKVFWFSDRIEISNPGGLYGQVTPENYERVSDYRNPVIAEAMKVLGYVEKFGTGIARANAALRKNRNPPAEFTFQPTHVLVIIRGLR